MVETKRPPGAVCGKKVRQAREQRGLSLTNLAGLAKISVSYLSEVENGRKSPSLQVLQRLAEALNLETAALFTDGLKGRISPGQRIRLLRTEEGLTLAQLAKKAGIGASYLSEIEREQVSPAPATLNRIAEALGTGVGQILGPLAGLGVRLRQAREDLGYSQAELAERAAVSPGLVGQIERGEVQPSLLTLDNLAAALGVSPCYLIREEDPADSYARLSPAVRELLAKPQAQAVLERICTCTPEEMRFLLEFLNLYKRHHCLGVQTPPPTSLTTDDELKGEKEKEP